MTAPALVTRGPATMKFDWYQATFKHIDQELIVPLLQEVFLTKIIEELPRSPIRNYPFAIALKSSPTETVCTVAYGGKNGGCHVLVTGEPSDLAASKLRGLNPHISRCDVAMDFAGEGLFDKLTRRALKWAKQNGIIYNQKGRWNDSEARTLYLGSPSSRVMVRIYEKGWERTEKGDPSDLNWVRVEVQLRPNDSTEKHHVGTLDAEGVIASTWATDLYAFLGIAKLIREKSFRSKKPLSDTEIWRIRLAKTYGKGINLWVQEAGSLEAFFTQFVEFYDRPTPTDVPSLDEFIKETATPPPF